jgi:hypothetical protein
MRCPELHELPPAPADKSGWPWTVASPPLPETMPNGDAWPKITIVTPSYNQGEFLEETIRSVLLQGYPNLEYLIMDGGSTDHSVAIIQKYAPWLTAWVSERDRGQSHAINKGFARATGTWLGWACTHFGNTLETPYLRQPLPEAFRPETLRLTMEFDQPACLWQRTLFTQVGPLTESLHYAFDWEFFIKCGPHIRLASLTDNVAFYRHHEQHKSGGGGWKRTNELIKIYATHLPLGQRLAFIPLQGNFWLTEKFDKLRDRPHCYRLSTLVLRWLDRRLPYQPLLHPFIRMMFGLPTEAVLLPVHYSYPVPGL